MLQELHSQLRQFGLNPKEWVLEIKSCTKEFCQCEIWPVQDKGLHFLGSAHRGVWIALQLVDHG